MKITCNVIRDLFPSYIDRLTSKESDQLVEEHVAECAECAKILSDMKAGSGQQAPPSEKEKKEIDFLKKNKKRNFRIGIYCIIGAVICLVLVGLIHSFGMGFDRMGAENWCVEKISVENGEIHFKATSVDSFSWICQIVVSEDAIGENDVLIIPAVILVNPVHAADQEFTHKLSNPEKLKNIYFGDRLIYSNGEAITQKTAELYKESHAYIGNAVRNQSLAGALSLQELLGPFENELETETEPYGWTVKIGTDYNSKEQGMREGYMDSSAYVMIALIGNLDHVTYQYTVDGKPMTRTITAEDGTQVLGRNIKDCYENPNVLQDLLTKLGWN